MGAPTTVSWTRDQVAARILAGDNLFILHDQLIRVPQAWLSAHPGGALSILHFLGRDPTDEVEAYHSEVTLRKMRAYSIGTVEIGENGWEPLLPPISTGWIRKVGPDGHLHWHREANALYSSENTDESPSSQILLLKRDDASTTVRFTPRSLFSMSFTCWASFRRRTPLSTIIAWNLYEVKSHALQFEYRRKIYLSPIASCINFAATVLSTPPLTAPMTRPFGPHISRIRLISLPINSS